MKITNFTKISLRFSLNQLEANVISQITNGAPYRFT